ncbi:ADP-ribosylglycohydrolase family protein [Sulfuriferula sp.]|uniref:ADP-ribosylglycohydrolase family protein n=1 Tax=Sulfuriferula sp. TaxID=2025307 RepID=UPI002730D7A9|nr:ADP-ribosylglycohydrolase family protein [Sulfuriferula sp.]MDP2026561.1 ADP-ribosylglycohydrolase family protein [Sulfuriferula sp.]
MTHDEGHERALGAYLGFAVGDALGATVEFMMPAEIQHAYGIHRDMVGGGWLKLKPGQITDDTQMSLALVTLHDDDAFTQATREQCHITHHHPLSDAATLALGRMTQALIHSGGIKGCRAEANRLTGEFPVFRFDPYPKHASGYIVDTVQTVLYHFFRTDSFESCVTEVVNCGEDADTNGALASMLADAAYGVSGIPGYWLKKLDKEVRQRIEAQTEALLRLAQNVKKDA